MLCVCVCVCVCACVRQARVPVESAGREEANGRKWLAVEDHVHQHQLDSHHPSHGTCTHARPSDGNLKAFFFFDGPVVHGHTGVFICVAWLDLYSRQCQSVLDWQLSVTYEHISVHHYHLVCSKTSTVLICARWVWLSLRFDSAHKTKSCSAQQVKHHVYWQQCKQHRLN